MKAVWYVRTVSTPLAPASNVQGASCTCVLCNVGTLHPRLHDPHREIKSTSTTSDNLYRVVDSTHQAICKTLLMYSLDDMLQKQGMWCFVYSLERCSLFFMTQVKKNFKPQMFDIVLSVTYVCWVNDFLLWYWLLVFRLFQHKFMFYMLYSHKFPIM